MRRNPPKAASHLWLHRLAHQLEQVLEAVHRPERVPEHKGYGTLLVTSDAERQCREVGRGASR